MLDKGEKLKIAFNDRRASFQINTDKDSSGLVDSIYLYSKVVEGNYPNYQQVIPKETHQRIKLERELFAQCIHRAALVCSEKSNSVKLKLTNNPLEIFAQSPDFGEAHEEMAVAYSGGELQIAFNPTYLLDGLGALDTSHVRLAFTIASKPAVLSGTVGPDAEVDDSYLYLLMPVRVAG